MTRKTPAERAQAGLRARPNGSNCLEIESSNCRAQHVLAFVFCEPPINAMSLWPRHPRRAYAPIHAGASSPMKCRDDPVTPERWRIAGEQVRELSEKQRRRNRSTVVRSGSRRRIAFRAQAQDVLSTANRARRAGATIMSSAPGFLVALDAGRIQRESAHSAIRCQLPSALIALFGIWLSSSRRQG